MGDIVLEEIEVTLEAKLEGNGSDKLGSTSSWQTKVVIWVLMC